MILQKYKNFSPTQCEVIVVVGGDGFMLHTLKKYQKYNKPFYGINRGTFAFLMNKFKTYDISKIISTGSFLSFTKIFCILNKRNSNDNIKSNKSFLNSLFSSSQLPTTYENVSSVFYGFGCNS